MEEGGEEGGWAAEPVIFGKRSTFTASAERRLSESLTANVSCYLEETAKASSSSGTRLRAPDPTSQPDLLQVRYPGPGSVLDSQSRGSAAGQLAPLLGAD